MKWEINKSYISRQPWYTGRQLECSNQHCTCIGVATGEAHLLPWCQRDAGSGEMRLGVLQLICQRRHVDRPLPYVLILVGIDTGRIAWLRVLRGASLGGHGAVWRRNVSDCVTSTGCSPSSLKQSPHPYLATVFLTPTPRTRRVCSVQCSYFTLCNLHSVRPNLPGLITASLHLFLYRPLPFYEDISTQSFSCSAQRKYRQFSLLSSILSLQYSFYRGRLQFSSSGICEDSVRWGSTQSFSRSVVSARWSGTIPVSVPRSCLPVPVRRLLFAAVSSFWRIRTSETISVTTWTAADSSLTANPSYWTLLLLLLLFWWGWWWWWCWWWWGGGGGGGGGE